MKKIVLIEDDADLFSLLKYNLEREGYVLVGSQTGKGAVDLCRREKPDLLILDIMLPDSDGLEICRAVRAHPELSHIPILFLTAKATETDRIVGLELGADDYLVKPFSFAELLARLRTIVRRQQGTAPESTLRVADLELDLARLRATRAHQKIELTAKEFQLLALLTRRQGEVLSRTVIASDVWDVNFDSDTNVVEVAIRRLRKKVDDPFADKLIHTVRGVGYVLEAGRK